MVMVGFFFGLKMVMVGGWWGDASQSRSIKSVWSPVGPVGLMLLNVVTMMMMVVMMMKTTWPLGVERCVREATKCANSWAVLLNVINVKISMLRERFTKLNNKNKKY